MARGVNKAIILGRLGQDPEVRYSQSGSAMATLSVATQEQWKDKQTGEQKKKVEWHRIVLFGRTAEIAKEYLRKGSEVYIEGKIQTRKWQDQQGNDKYTTEINGRELQLLGSGTQSQSQQPAQPAQQPAQAPAQQQIPTSTQQAPVQQPLQPQGEDPFDDDIPF